ncbi:hypothetical protein [Priestia aryabhattai]
MTKTESESTQRKPIARRSYIKFVEQKNNFKYIYISSKLRKLFQRRNYTHIELGIEPNKSVIFIKCNNNGKGIALLGRVQNESIYGAQVIKKLEQLSINNEILNKEFLVLEISNNLFALNKAISTNQYMTNYKESICWLSNVNIRRDQDFIIRFESNNPKKDSSHTLIFRTRLLTFISNQDDPYMQFGFNNETASIFVRFNKDNKGIYLLDLEGIYRDKVAITSYFRHLQTLNIGLENNRSYYLQHIEGLLFRLTKNQIDLTEKVTINTKEIVWVDKEEN